MTGVLLPERMRQIEPTGASEGPKPIDAIERWVDDPLLGLLAFAVLVCIIVFLIKWRREK